MSASHIESLLQSWETIRCELLNTKITDLHLKIEGSPVEPYSLHLLRQLEGKGIRFKPGFYLTDTWGCPNKVPAIGIPFYLADKRLSRLEEEETGEIEDAKTIMMYLRHEAGHAVNYAYRLWKMPGWRETFGPFSKPYPNHFRPNRLSREFVPHLKTTRYGQAYAQKHPDEDFAETFAVWLMPRSNWRWKYRFWPALEKLKFVDQLMKDIRGKMPRSSKGALSRPVENMNLRLAKFYGTMAERHQRAALGFVDDKLKEIFPPIRESATASASELLAEFRRDLQMRIVRWSGLSEDEVGKILGKLQSRAESLKLQYRKNGRTRKLMDITALGTAMAQDYSYTGRLTG